MQSDFIPAAIQPSFAEFLNYLQQLDCQRPLYCPRCTSEKFNQTRAMPLTFHCENCYQYFNPLTNTPFNRLIPTNWFAIILLARVNFTTYQAIADDFDCSIKIITNRDKAIISAMQYFNPELYEWYIIHTRKTKTSENNRLTPVLSDQHFALKQRIITTLSTTTANCLHCDSANTVKQGQRTAFHCRACRRSFNLLASTPISRLRNADKWLRFIDLLVAQNKQATIANQLDFDLGTVGNWRRKWCATMHQWQLTSLAIWCQRKGSN